LRRPVTRRRREITDALVAPRPVERMLHHGQELDVCEPHLRDVVGEGLRDLAIAEPSPVVPPPPRAEMHLVDRPRRVERVRGRALRHPFRVAPVVLERPETRSGSGRRLEEERERVALVDAVTAVARHDVILVCRAALDAWDERLPYSGGVV